MVGFFFGLFVCLLLALGGFGFCGVCWEVGLGLGLFGSFFFFLLLIGFFLRPWLGLEGSSFDTNPIITSFYLDPADDDPKRRLNIKKQWYIYSTQFRLYVEPSPTPLPHSRQEMLKSHPSRRLKKCKKGEKKRGI